MAKISRSRSSAKKTNPGRGRRDLLCAAMLDALPGAGLLVDGDGIILSWNQAAAERFAQKLEPGRPALPQVLRHVPESYWRKTLTRLCGEKRAIRFERNLGGEFFFYNLQPVLDTKGALRFIIVFIQDVTEYRYAEHALAESEKKYRQLVENISDTIYALNEDGTVIYANPAIKDFLGLTPDEVMGRPLQDFLHPADMLLVKNDLERFLGGQLPRTEYRFNHRDGVTRWGRVSSLPVIFKESVIGYQGTITDITQAKSSNVSLLKAVQENILDNLASSFATEIGVPLKRARERLLDARAGEDLGPGPLRDLMHDLEGISLYLKNLNAFMTERNIDALSVDVNTLIENGLILMKRRLERNNIEVHGDFNHGLEPVAADPFALVQAFMNIFNISIQTSSRAGRPRRLSVTTAMEKDNVIVDIRDDSGAVIEEAAGRIGEGGGHPRQPPEIGIGLAIARQLLENQSGGLELCSGGKESGLHVRIVLPAVIQSL